MDRIRRSLRDSFRRKKDHVPESSKPHQWQADEIAVRNGNCVFPVKYLGCVEVFESRGMQVCEEALKVLRSSRRRPIKGTLFVTGDGLRVVDDDTKGLIVDQTIEKVSFCAPDRSHERGFSYICRDGTTRRWMCHGFHASKDSGERLSHAVGCAFTVCLERKQKRDKEMVTMTFDAKTSSFTRTGSFKQTSITERLQDPQIAKPAEPPPVKAVHNPFAVERPHATANLLQRQGSLRGGPLNTVSPFKRQLSLRVNDLPSNMERQRSHSIDVSMSSYSKINGGVAPIAEVSPNEPSDSISAMCQELSKGLKMLSSTDEGLSQEKKSMTNPPANDQVTGNSLSGKQNGSSAFPDNWSNTSQQSKQSAQKQVSAPAQSSGKQQPKSAAFPSQTPVAAPRYNNPNFSQLRSHSLGSADAFFDNRATGDRHNNTGANNAGANNFWTNSYQSQSTAASSGVADPFDSEWNALASRHHQKRNTNPFTQTQAPVKAFEVHM